MFVKTPGTKRLLVLDATCLLACDNDAVMGLFPHLAVPPLPPGCPWSDWLPPNIKWCEENLCAWITAPANTWSNVAYWAVAAFIWMRPRAARASLLAFYAPACVFLGVASFMFHASYTLFFQFFDYLGMFAILALLGVLNLQRAGAIGQASARRAYCAVVVTLCGALALLQQAGFPYQLLIVLLALVVIGQEVHLQRSGRAAGGYGWFVAAVLSLLAATTFTVLDLTRCWCEPANHWLQGHALWHVLSALSLYCAYRFFEPLGVSTIEPNERDRAERHAVKAQVEPQSVRIAGD